MTVQIAQAQTVTGEATGTAPAPPPDLPDAPEGFIDQLLAFLYTLAHWAGELIVGLLQEFMPPATHASLASLIDPIGVLALLTVFLILAEVAKKITWLILIVGWALIIVKIVMEATTTAGP